MVKNPGLNLHLKKIHSEFQKTIKSSFSGIKWHLTIHNEPNYSKKANISREQDISRKVDFIEKVRLAWETTQARISKTSRDGKQIHYIKKSSSLEKLWFEKAKKSGWEKSHFYNHLHIGDKPGYYLHGNRLQYLQSQGWKQSETLTSCIFGVKLDTVSVHSPEKAQGDFLAEKQRF